MREGHERKKKRCRQSTTLSTAATTIGGGTATNVTPDYCEFTFEIRHLPEHDAEAVIADLQQTIMETLDAEMKAKAEDTGFTFEKIFSYPGMGDCTDAEAFSYVSNIIPEISGKGIPVDEARDAKAALEAKTEVKTDAKSGNKEDKKSKRLPPSSLRIL